MKNNLVGIVDLGPNIWVIVITGGPCGGKTSGLAILTSKLTDRGYKVLVSPESATKLMGAGIIPGKDGLEGMEFQEEILLDTIEQENRIFTAAKRYRDKGRKVIILCDRGTMDGEAYVEPTQFGDMLQKLGFNRRILCDERYHAVIHLRTAALGAETYYTLTNNTTRTETPEVARAIDQRTFEAWQRHPHPRVIDNSTSFEEKMRRTLAEICVVIGDPVPTEREDRFLIEYIDPKQLPVKYHTTHITQDYLTSADPRETCRVRARKDVDGTTYYLTTKRFFVPGNRVEIDRIITVDEYHSQLARKDPRYETIIKKRVCFFWKERHFEMDYFESPPGGRSLLLLEIEHTDETIPFELPPFISVILDVTDKNKYSNVELARKK